MLSRRTILRVVSAILIGAGATRTVDAAHQAVKHEPFYRIRNVFIIVAGQKLGPATIIGRRDLIYSLIGSNKVVQLSCDDLLSPYIDRLPPSLEAKAEALVPPPAIGLRVLIHLHRREEFYLSRALCTSARPLLQEFEEVRPNGRLAIPQFHLPVTDRLVLSGGAAPAVRFAIT